MTQAYSEKGNPSAPIRRRTLDLLITSSDALPLSYRRLVGAKAIKLGSWDKQPYYLRNFLSSNFNPGRASCEAASFIPRRLVTFPSLFPRILGEKVHRRKKTNCLRHMKRKCVPGLKNSSIRKQFIFHILFNATGTQN